MKEQSVWKRRSCALIRFRCASYRCQPVVRSDAELASKLYVIAAGDPTIGYRTAWACLRQNRLPAKRSWIHRVWSEEDLSNPHMKDLNWARQGSFLFQVVYANPLWACDFVHNRTEDIQPLQFPSVEGKHTRKRVEQSTPIKWFIDVSKALSSQRGTFRSNTGPRLATGMAQRTQRADTSCGSGEFLAECAWEKSQRDSSVEVSVSRTALPRTRSASEDEPLAVVAQQTRTSQSDRVLNACCFRNSARVPLLKRSRPSTHRRQCEVEKKRRESKQAVLYALVVQS